MVFGNAQLSDDEEVCECVAPATWKNSTEVKEYMDNMNNNLARRLLSTLGLDSSMELNADGTMSMTNADVEIR
jgi:uncharacterized lipoprotein NlpE involved in copper resistance